MCRGPSAPYRGPIREQPSGAPGQLSRDWVPSRNTCICSNKLGWMVHTMTDRSKCRLVFPTTICGLIASIPSPLHAGVRKDIIILTGYHFYNYADLNRGVIVDQRMPSLRNGPIAEAGARFSMKSGLSTAVYLSYCHASSRTTSSYPYLYIDNSDAPTMDTTFAEWVTTSSIAVNTAALVGRLGYDLLKGRRVHVSPVVGLQASASLTRKEWSRSTAEISRFSVCDTCAVSTEIVGFPYETGQSSEMGSIYRSLEFGLLPGLLVELDVTRRVGLLLQIDWRYAVGTDLKELVFGSPLYDYVNHRNSTLRHFGPNALLGIKIGLQLQHHHWNIQSVNDLTPQPSCRHDRMGLPRREQHRAGDLSEDPRQHPFGTLEAWLSAI